MSHRSAAVAIGTVALALVGLATVSESPAPEWPRQAASASEPERVRIEHEIVRIPITGAPELRGPRAVAPKPDRGPAALGRVASARPQPDGAGPPASAARAGRRGVISRTVQSLVGDGRYKPQPFPRPGG